MSNTIAVIGAGNGGTAISAFLAGKGASVNLCDLFPQYVEGIQKEGGITLTIEGKTTRETLNYVGTDVARAIKGVKLIMVVTPSFTHKMIAEACSPLLEDGQIIVLNPGRTGGAVEFLATVRKLGCTKDIEIGRAHV